MSFQYGNCIETGASIPTTFRYYKFRVPDADWIIKAALGQFLMQVYESGWFENGGVTVADAAEAFQQIQESVVEIPSPIGSIVAYASNLPVSSDLVPCNGQALFRADFPELFSAIGTVWGAPDLLTFNVPDLRGRVQIGRGQGPGLTNWPIGTYFGEEQHQLTSPEMPSHFHGYNGAFDTTPAGGGADVVAQSAVFNTSPVGNDQPHNNMQPLAVIAFGIVAR